MPVVPASPTPPPQGGAPQAPPIGGSPAIAPSPNRGYEQAGKQKLAIVLKGLQDVLSLYGASSEQGQVILKAMTSLGKLAQPGDVSEQGEMNGLKKMLMTAAQGAREQQSLGKGAAAGGQPTPQGAAPAAQAA